MKHQINFIAFSILVVCSIILLSTCQKKEAFIDNKINTREVSGIAQNNPVFHGSLVKGTQLITKVGFQYKALQSTSWQYVEAILRQDGSFSTNTRISVIAGTTYEVRAYAIAIKDTLYGNMLSFTTLPPAATYSLTLSTAVGGTLQAYTDVGYTSELIGTALNSIPTGTTIYLKATPANSDIATTDIVGAENYMGNTAEIIINSSKTIVASFGTIGITINRDGYVTDYTGTSNTVLIPTSIRSTAIIAIDDNAFNGKSTITSVTIPESILSIGDNAFINCSSLQSIAIPSSVINIGNWAFNGCQKLTSFSVAVGNTAYSAIGGVLFDKAQEILLQYPIGNTATTYTIPNSVKTIRDNAFQYGNILTNITIPNSVTNIGSRVFEDCINLRSVSIGSNVTAIGNDAFKGCSNLRTIAIPNSVTNIGGGAFNGCSLLGNITLGNMLTSIGDETFLGCSSLSNIILPNSVGSIGNSAFSGCSLLGSITLGNMVTSIGNDAFFGCSSLPNITLPSSVGSIGNQVFLGCSMLANIRIEATTPPTLGNLVFTGIAGSFSIEVPAASLTNYLGAAGWSGWASNLSGYAP